MNHLLRSLAPISDAGWELLDGEAKARVTPALAVRRLVDFAGPLGWEQSATNLGRTTPLGASPGEGVSGQQRRVLPLVELRADFELSRSELRDADRGAADTDLSALDDAARKIAVAENVAVFHGWQNVISGIAESSPHDPLPLGDPESYPGQWPVRSSSCWRAASPVRTDRRWEARPTASRSGRRSTAAFR